MAHTPNSHLLSRSATFRKHYTPTATYADFTGLADLPQVDLRVEHRFEREGDGQAVYVTLENPGETIAFFVEMSVVGADSGQLAAPIFWSDNYVSLLPGERREVRASIPAHALDRETPVFRYHGVNVIGE